MPCVRHYQLTCPAYLAGILHLQDVRNVLAGDVVHILQGVGIHELPACKHLVILTQEYIHKALWWECF